MKSLVKVGSSTVEVIKFVGTDLLAVRELVSRGEIVLLCNAVPLINDGIDQWPRSVAESIGECAVVPLACLIGEKFRRYPLVVGQKDTIRFICSYADQLPPRPLPYETLPVRTHYWEFRNLWAVHKSMVPNAFMFQLGGVIASMHSMKVLHGDAHLSNWGIFDGQVATIDNDVVFLYNQPSPAQCATDVSPLLPALKPNDWLNFRLGYCTTWPDGARVIDFIQLGDHAEEP